MRKLLIGVLVMTSCITITNTDIVIMSVHIIKNINTLFRKLGKKLNFPAGLLFGGFVNECL